MHWPECLAEARTVYKVLRTFTLPLQTLMLVQAEPPPCQNDLRLGPQQSRNSFIPRCLKVLEAS